MKTSKKGNKITEEKYSKKQIVNSKIFNNNKDLLNALLNENETYTKNEVYEIIEKFKKGKVK